MSDNPLSKLDDVLEGLSTQESELAEKLTETRAKLEAIRSVISLFEESGEMPAPVESKPAAKKKAAPKAEKAAPKATATKKTTRKAKATRSTKASTKAKKQTASKKTTKKSGKKKVDGRAASWQKYALPGVTETPMPEAVRMILATAPDQDFKIADVMAGLFKEDMPRNHYLKARNRISNILSGGVREGEWHKGARGSYRLEPAG